MRKPTILFAFLVLGLLLTGGVAMAITKTCTTNPCEGTPDNDTLFGTEESNQIRALGGNDTLLGRGARDTLVGGKGDDIEKGGAGNDQTSSGFPARAAGDDRIYGGDGDDNLVDYLGSQQDYHHHLRHIFGHHPRPWPGSRSLSGRCPLHLFRCRRPYLRLTCLLHHDPVECRSHPRP